MNHVEKHHGWAAKKKRTGTHYAFGEYWTIASASQASGCHGKLSQDKSLAGFNAYKGAGVHAWAAIGGTLEARPQSGSRSMLEERESCLPHRACRRSADK